jgi:hypothetical protein
MDECGVDMQTLRDYKRYWLYTSSKGNDIMHGLELSSLTEELFVGEMPNEALAKDPRHELVRKIKRSMGEIGPAEGSWAEVAETYRRMRQFSLGDNPDFELRLDHITDTDGWGKTKNARICIDGIFAYLLYYQKKHIFTIGFSILDGKRLLIGQVQAAKELKGWGLQFLPRNRLEFVIERFAEAFAGYELYLVCGGAMADRVLADYRTELAKAEQERDEATREEYRKCIWHLTNERPRLVATYLKTGRFKLVPHGPFNNIEHYRIEL